MNVVCQNSRIGAVSVLLPLLSSYGVSVGAYLSFLVVPVLGRMSDPVPEVRHQASLCFARAVRLMPLEAGIPNPGTTYLRSSLPRVRV